MVVQCSWIQDQKLHHLEDVWIDGAEDYIQHARSLLQELADDNKIVMNGSSGSLKPNVGSHVASAPVLPAPAVAGAKKESMPVLTPSLGFSQPEQRLWAPPQTGLGLKSQLQGVQTDRVQENGEKPAVNAPPGSFSFLGGSTAAPSFSRGGGAQGTSGAVTSFPAFGASAAPFSQNVTSSSALNSGSAFSWSIGATGMGTCNSQSTSVGDCLIMIID